MEDCTNRHDGRTQQDGLLPAQRLANDHGENGSETTSNGVKGADCSQETRLARSLQVERVEEVVCHDYAAKNA